MSTRYIKQPHKYTCGPTVIINALKWAGVRLNKETVTELYLMLCNSMIMYTTGTNLSAVGENLQVFTGEHLKIRKDDMVTVEEMDEHLIQDGAIIIAHPYSPKSKRKSAGHVFIIIGKSSGKYICANASGKFTKSISLMTRTALGNLLIHQHGHTFEAVAWYLTRKAKINEKEA